MNKLQQANELITKLHNLVEKFYDGEVDETDEECIDFLLDEIDEYLDNNQEENNNNNEWEYTITSTIDEVDALTHLNYCGKLGWELVYMYKDDFNYMKFVFKRPKGVEQNEV